MIIRTFREFLIVNEGVKIRRPDDNNNDVRVVHKKTLHGHEMESKVIMRKDKNDPKKSEGEWLWKLDKTYSRYKNPNPQSFERETKVSDPAHKKEIKDAAKKSLEHVISHRKKLGLASVSWSSYHPGQNKEYHKLADSIAKKTGGKNISDSGAATFGGTPRFAVKFDEGVLSKPTPSIRTLAKRHGMSMEKVRQQIAMGRNIEKEHTNSAKAAREIARDHIDEFPGYYPALKKMEKKLKK